MLLLGGDDDLAPLAEALAAAGFDARACSAEALDEALAERRTVAVLVDVGREAALNAHVRSLLAAAGRPAVIALIEPPGLDQFDVTLGFDDFVLRSAPVSEVVARLRQAAWRRGAGLSEHLIRAGDLVIDQSNYRVAVGGRPVELTYREYELLRFLAQNPDRVFTREMLLNRVWGYDFYGGARTVDVHVRRLRSKIEEAGKTYIETVRNVGYRFHAD